MQDGAEPTASLELPPRIDLPFFAYGLEKPGEPAYDELVGAKVGQIRPGLILTGSLRYRDGLPLLDPEGTGGVEGAILHFLPGQELETYAAISAFAPRQHYRWLTTDAQLANDETMTVNVLRGRRPRRGSPNEWFRSWSAVSDPALHFGTHTVRRLALEHAVAPFPSLTPDSPALWERFFGLQSAYLLLWLVLDRFAALAFGPGLSPTDRRNRLGDDPRFRDCVIAANVTPRPTAADSRDPQRSTRIREDGSGALYYWHTVQANLSHPGRTAFHDGVAVRQALVELHDTFRLLLLRCLPDLADAWEALDPEGASHLWLLRPVVFPEGMT
jgi:hypothetical protein